MHPCSGRALNAASAVSAVSTRTAAWNGRADDSPVQNERVAVVGWTVLALVFVDELLAMAALGIYGWSATPRWLLVWLLPLLATMAWSLFASPKARFGTPAARAFVKLLVFGLAALGLWSAGHPQLALGMLVFSVMVNGLAMSPRIRELASAAMLGDVAISDRGPREPPP